MKLTNIFKNKVFNSSKSPLEGAIYEPNKRKVPGRPTCYGAIHLEDGTEVKLDLQTAILWAILQELKRG